MQRVLNALLQVDFIALLWLFPIAYALHEAEEWNILDWERRNFVGLGETSERGARTWLVFVSLVGFLWCAVATLPGNPSLAAYLFLPAIAIACQNALQHVYWLFYFRQYAPGVITSTFLLLPIGTYLVLRAIGQGYVSPWYVVLWAALTVPGLVQTVRAGNQMLPQILAIHRLGERLSERLLFTKS